ncbi:MAG: peptidogalycan biosysnthesis protein, partial [Burkholderiales bacterium]
MNRSYQIKIVETLSEIPAQSWNELAGDAPFLHYEFFTALHESGCACPQTGWTPRFITLWQNGSLAGAMPLYLKAHSYGEYVFDWAWADAYRRSGHRYYPKLLCAVPFTPITGKRL